MLSPSNLKTVAAAATAGNTTVIERPPGAVTTAVSDLAVSNQSGQTVTIASALGELPAVIVDQVFAIEDHGTAGNNGVFKVLSVVTATEEITAVKLGSVAPADAAAEAATVFTDVNRRFVVVHYHISTPSAAGTVSLLASQRTLAATPTAAFEQDGGPVMGDVGEALKVSAVAETGTARVTYGWIRA